MVSAWGFGASINVVGSILINLGTNVMKLGHNRRAAHEAVIKPPIRSAKSNSPSNLLEKHTSSALGHLGAVMHSPTFLSRFFGPISILIILALLSNLRGFAAQSLLAALGSVQFVSNVFFASVVLGEQVTRSVIIATLCIVAGCILLVSCGNHESQTLTISDMLAFYESPVYVTFLVLLVLATGCFFFAYHYGQQKLAWMGRDALEDRWVKSLPVTYALFSGTIGTQSVLFCKTLSTLLRTTFAGDSQLHSYFFWLTFLSFVATAYFWITRLNLGLQLFPAIIIVPMMQISWTMFSILSGGIYFQEYLTLSLARGFGYGLGVAVVFVGVYLLTPASKPVNGPHDLEAGFVDGSGREAEPTAPLVDLPHIPDLHRPTVDYSSRENHEETSLLLGNLSSSSSGLKALSMGGYTGSSKTLYLSQGIGEEAAPSADSMPFHEHKSPPQLAVDPRHAQIPARHADSRSGAYMSNRLSSVNAI